jgi:hypothetical protein
MVAAEAFARFGERSIALRGKWQALAWTHYRSLLSDLAVRTAARSGESRFDFVTFSSGQFGQRLSATALAELQYSANASHKIDFVICDIEEIDDLEQQGVFFGDLAKPVRYSVANIHRLLSKPDVRTSLMEFFRAQSGDAATDIPKLFRSRLQPTPRQDERRRTLGIPLRWGYNGIALKMSADSVAALSADGFQVPAAAFDLDWLLTDHAVRRWAIKNKALTMLDWYLPTMLLLGWHVAGPTPHALRAADFAAVREKLYLLTEMVDFECGICKDPVELKNKVAEATDLIVFGGGNWLRDSHDAAHDGGLMLMPIRQGCLIWCECLVFLAPANNQLRDFGVQVNAAWEADAARIISWLLSRGDLAAQCRFPAYLPCDVNAMDDLLENARTTNFVPVPVLRRLPPRESANRVTRGDWEEAWNQWKREAKELRNAS